MASDASGTVAVVPATGPGRQACPQSHRCVSGRFLSPKTAPEMSGGAIEAPRETAAGFVGAAGQLGRSTRGELGRHQRPHSLLSVVKDHCNPNVKEREKGRSGCGNQPCTTLSSAYFAMPLSAFTGWLRAQLQKRPRAR